jgi:acetylornithine deacetylase/succinyl-diaminopimelate desuccinylase family protein
MPDAEVLETLAALVRVDSVNPAYPGGAGEGEIARYISGYFQERGVRTRQQEVFPGRPNVIAVLPGRRPGRRLILEAHTDTVSANGMAIPPFEPVREGTRLYVRGACDTKAGLAAMMHAVASVAAERLMPPCEIWLAAAVDEEHSYRGVVKLLEDRPEGAGAIVAEPTGLRAVIATKGVLRWRVRTLGRAAHSSKPHLGVNAITGMARLILALEQAAVPLASAPYPLLGPGTQTISVIQGGRQVNFVPDECVIEIDRRLLPGEDAARILEDCRVLASRVTAEQAGLEAVVEPPMLEDYPLATPAEAPIVQAALSVLASMGRDATPAGVPFGSDASKFARAGIPAIVCGPGSIDQAHAAIEYVECEEVLAAAEFYRRMILTFE